MNAPLRINGMTAEIVLKARAATCIIFTKTLAVGHRYEVTGIPFRNPTSASVVEPITGMFVFWHLDDLLPSFLCLLGCGESDVLSKGLKDLTNLVRNLIACSTTFGEGKYGQKHNSYFSGAWPTILFGALKKQNSTLARTTVPSSSIYDECQTQSAKVLAWP